MRLYLKTVEFQSIGHLLEVCQGFRYELNNIELTPSNASDGGCQQVELCNNPDAVRQAIRDLQREVITINGHVLPPVTSRKDLINFGRMSMLSDAICGDAFVAFGIVGNEFGCPPGSADAALGVDDNVVWIDEANLQQWGQRQDRRCWIAAGVGDDLSRFDFVSEPFR